MASIYERGNSYRMVFRRKHYPIFCLSFDDPNAARIFANKNELDFLKNPEKWFEWRQNLSLLMRHLKVDCIENIIKPRLRS